ncbi:MAG: type IV toxin-antitoxin system AbiEi family antitoxin domain-containing protein [Cyanobacteria bacterium]|nr:type IV toxin-antitoxin system AbiEi family antitoxin domain-containing protein [Cyanobacteriota bacterium]
MKPSIDLGNDQAWFVAVPKRQEFSAPSFHLGERVKWPVQGTMQSGRIFGLTYQPETDWQYLIRRDSEAPQSGLLEYHPAPTLTLVPDRHSLRDHLGQQQPWQFTAAAATALGISATQLRRLRRNGLFKVGHHYRDTSLPGSDKPRWQWHIERCTRALATPPEQRDQPCP